MTTAAANGTVKPAWELHKERAEAEQAARRDAARPAAAAFDARAKSIRAGGPKPEDVLISDFIGARYDVLEAGPGCPPVRKLYRQAWFALAQALYAAGPDGFGGYRFEVAEMAIVRPFKRPDGKPDREAFAP